MIELVPFTAEQARHLEEVRDLWEVYGDALRERRAYVGGMQWKTIAGREYLYRYGPDPVTGKKRSTSVGRRSPETVRLHSSFMARRASLDARLEGARPRVETQARVSRALRLARMPTGAGALLREIWMAGLSEHVWLTGSLSLYAFETASGMLTGGGAIPEGDLDLLVPSAVASDVVQELAAVLVRNGGYEFDPSLQRFVSGSGPAVDVLTTEAVLQRCDVMRGLDDGEWDCVEWALAADPVQALAIDRSGTPVPVTSMQPRALALLKLVRAEKDSARLLAARRLDKAHGVAAARIASEAGLEPFEDRHLRSLPELEDAIGSTGWDERSPRF